MIRTSLAVACSDAAHACTHTRCDDGFASLLAWAEKGSHQNHKERGEMRGRGEEGKGLKMDGYIMGKRGRGGSNIVYQKQGGRWKTTIPRAYFWDGKSGQPHQGLSGSVAKPIDVVFLGLDPPLEELHLFRALHLRRI